MRTDYNEANRIAVIGCGHVGATIAYALMMQGIAREIVLIDSDRRHAEGEAMDLRQAVPLHGSVNIWAGDYKDVGPAAIAVIAAGVSTQPGQTRLDLIETNAAVVRDCLRNLTENGFAGIILMTTNPVDVLAQLAQEESGFASGRVFGSGTLLDTARLQSDLKEQLGVDARSIDVFIIGEHGKSEVAAWSAAQIGGAPLRQYCAGNKPIDPDELLERARQAAPEIVARKGYTSFAIASCVAWICRAVLYDEHLVLPVSTLVAGAYGISGVYLSLPCVVGRSGVERVIELPLAPAELEGLRRSAAIVLAAVEAQRPTRVSRQGQARGARIEPASTPEA